MTTATATRKRSSKAKVETETKDHPPQLNLKTSVVDSDELEFLPRGARGSKWANFVAQVLELDVGAALKVPVPSEYKAEAWRNRVSNVIYNRITKPGHGEGYTFATRVTKDSKFVAVVCSKAAKE